VSATTSTTTQISNYPESSTGCVRRWKSSIAYRDIPDNSSDSTHPMQLLDPILVGRQQNSFGIRPIVSNILCGSATPCNSQDSISRMSLTTVTHVLFMIESAIGRTWHVCERGGGGGVRWDEMRWDERRNIRRQNHQRTASNWKTN
jgi:hypothetical protein